MLTNPLLFRKWRPRLKLHLAKSLGQNMFNGYGIDYVIINQVRYTKSLIVLSDYIIQDWQAKIFEQLTPEHFELLIPLKPEMVLFGTGKTLRFPPPSLTQALTTSRIGIEVMDTSAACRTYNILMSKGRNVAAAILI